MLKKIIITGIGNQGVKYLSKKLAELLVEKGYEVILTFSYDTAIAGGDIFSNLIFSNNKIENIQINKADILVELSKIKQDFEFKKKITSEEILKKFPDKRLNEGAFEVLKREMGL